MTKNEETTPFDTVLPRPVRILLVEDDLVDVEQVERVLRKNRLEAVLLRASDGVEALDMLSDTQSFSQPCLMLVDINMPRMDGFQFLIEMKKRKAAEGSIIYILTTSNRADDRDKARKLQVGYILKEDLATLGSVILKHCGPPATGGDGPPVAGHC